MGLDEEILKTLITRYEEENSIERILKTTCIRALPEGENFMSVIWRITCDVILKSGRETKRFFIVKEAVITGHHGQLLKEHSVFKREIQAYENVLKQMEHIMGEMRDHRETLWPEYIGSQENHLVVLQDLCTKGFKTVNRKEMLDFNHTLLLVTELARFHTVGLALLQKGRITQKYFTLYELSNEGLFRTFFIRALKAFGKAVHDAWGSEWKEAALRIEKSTEIAYETFFNMIQIDPERFNVINHGDCWSNNILFKWDDHQNPIGVKFLDFQFIHYNSFAVDLTYLIYNSTRPDVRRTHNDDILRAYRTSLETNLALYGINKKVPTLAEMKVEMNRLRFFGYLLLCSVHPVVTADVLPMDIEKVSDKTSESSDSINQEVFTNHKFKGNVMKDVVAFMEEGVI